MKPTHLCQNWFFLSSKIQSQRLLFSFVDDSTTKMTGDDTQVFIEILSKGATQKATKAGRHTWSRTVHTFCRTMGGGSRIFSGPWPGFASFRRLGATVAATAAVYSTATTNAAP